MARAAPKSKKRPAPKSKKEKPVPKEEEENEEQVDNNESEDDLFEPADSGNKSKNEKSDDDQGQSEEDEPPAKKGRGRPAAKKTPKKAAAKKKAGGSARGRKPQKKDDDDDDEDDEKEYEVEKILDQRKVKGNTEYFIKWKGYTAKQATWEPVAHLNCDDIIQKFEAQQEKRKNEVPRNMRTERKETERYADTAGDGSHRRHSRRGAKGSPRKSYREAPDSD